MDKLPEGFEAYEKTWHQDALPDARGPRSAVVWYERECFLESLQDLFPEVLQKFREEIFLPRRPAGNVVRLDREVIDAMRRARAPWRSRSEILRAVPDIRRFLESWELNCPWMLKVATLTLRDWIQQHSEGEALNGCWRNYDHAPPVDLGLPECAPSQLVWDVMAMTEREYREVLEAHIRERKLAAFRAGLVPRIGRPSGKVKLPTGRKYEYLLMHLVGRMTTEGIIEWFYLERGEEVGKYGIEKAIGDLSRVVGIPLPPRQGRNSPGRRSQVPTRQDQGRSPWE